MAYIHLKRNGGDRICDGGSIYYLKTVEEESGKAGMFFVRLDIKEDEEKKISGAKDAGNDDPDQI